MQHGFSFVAINLYGLLLEKRVDTWPDGLRRLVRFTTIWRELDLEQDIDGVMKQGGWPSKHMTADRSVRNCHPCAHAKQTVRPLLRRTLIGAAILRLFRR
jgi:hypothetical protein